MRTGEKVKLNETEVQTLVQLNGEAVANLGHSTTSRRDASRIEQLNSTLERAQGVLSSAAEMGRAWEGVAFCARDIAAAVVRLEIETRRIDAHLTHSLERSRTDALIIRESFANDQRHVDAILQKVLAIDLAGASPQLMAAWSSLLAQANVLSQRSHERMLAYLKR